MKPTGLFKALMSPGLLVFLVVTGLFCMVVPILLAKLVWIVANSRAVAVV